jgi:ribosomal protein S5
MAEVKIIQAKRGEGLLDTSTAVSLSSLSTAVYIDVSDVDASKILLEFAKSTAGTGLIFAVKAQGPFTGAGTNDILIASTAANTSILAGIETHRFKTTDGRIYFQKVKSTNTSSGSSLLGTVKAYLLP